MSESPSAPKRISNYESLFWSGVAGAVCLATFGTANDATREKETRARYVALSQLRIPYAQSMNDDWLKLKEGDDKPTTALKTCASEQIDKVREANKPVLRDGIIISPELKSSIDLIQLGRCFSEKVSADVLKSDLGYKALNVVRTGTAFGLVGVGLVGAFSMAGIGYNLARRCFQPRKRATGPKLDS